MRGVRRWWDVLGPSGRAWRSVRLSACLAEGQQKAGRAARWLVGWSRGTSCIVGLWLCGVRLCCAWPAAVLAVVADAGSAVILS